MNKNRKKRIVAYILGVVMIGTILISIIIYKLNIAKVDVVLMNTNVHIEVEGFNAKPTVKILISRISEFEKKFSTNLKDSLVYKINNADKDEEIVVDDEFIQLYDMAHQLYTMTNGKFDITTCPLTELWGFAPNTYNENTRVYVPPSKEEINKTLENVGFEKLLLDRDNKKIKKTKKGVKIDFGAIGKGYIADVVKDLAKEKNIKKGILQISSSIYVIGGPYNIAIKDPRDSGDNYIGKLSLKDISIVTSGDYQRFYVDSTSKRYHHIIDPTTGEPAENGVISASIINEKSWFADGLATAAVLLGYDEILKIIQSNKLQAIIVTGSNIFDNQSIYSIHTNFEYNDHDLKDKYLVKKID